MLPVCTVVADKITVQCTYTHVQYIVQTVHRDLVNEYAVVGPWTFQYSLSVLTTLLETGALFDPLNFLTWANKKASVQFKFVNKGSTLEMWTNFSKLDCIVSPSAEII